MLTGMNRFLASLEITFRRDPTNFRPRVNKLNSVKDREQKGGSIRLNKFCLSVIDRDFASSQFLGTTSSSRIESVFVHSGSVDKRQLLRNIYPRSW